MSRFRSFDPAGNQSEQEEVLAAKKEAIASLERQVNRELKRLGVTGCHFTLVQGSSINSYFLCESELQVRLLHGHYESGLMKDVLENIFSLLAGEKVNIYQHEWTTEKRPKCQQQFRQLSGTLIIVN